MQVPALCPGWDKVVEGPELAGMPSGLDVEVAPLAEGNKIDVPAVVFDHVQVVHSKSVVRAWVVVVVAMFTVPVGQVLDEVGDLRPV